MKDESGQASVRIELFNGPAITVGAETVRRFPTRHAEAILTMLALAPGRRISRDEIADTLWPDEALDASRRRIREHLYRLRKAIPDGRELILSEGDAICLSQEFSVSVDVLEFDRLLKRASELQSGREGEGEGEGERGRPLAVGEQVLSLLIAADGLYKGQFAPELDWPRFDGLRVRYAAMHLDLLRALSLLFAERDFKRAIEYGIRAVAADPLCEGAHEELIRLYAQAGKPEDARRQYRELEKTLRKELGTEPSREIAQFVQGINGTGISGPLPRLRANLRIPNRRAARLYGAVAAISLVLALVTLIAAKPWRRPKPTPEERIADIQQLRNKIAAARTPSERDKYQKEQAEECVELGEEAWRAWWGPDEEIWVNRLKRVDDDIQNSLAWLTKYDPRREIQLSGALTRYWVFPDDRLNREAHWLELVLQHKGSVDNHVKARALIGLARYYLLQQAAQARPGLKMALDAYRLYFNCNDIWGQAHALRYVALHKSHQDHKSEAIRDYQLVLGLFQRINNDAGLAQTYECMSYIPPESSSGTVSAATRLKWLIKASRLYRKVRNPRGRIDMEAYLISVARQTKVMPSTFESLKQVEKECRTWLDFEAGQNNEVQLRSQWRALAEIALMVGDQNTMVESLKFLRLIRGNNRPDSVYDYRLIGAYLKNYQWDPNHEIDPMAQIRRANSGLSGAGLALYRSQVEFGSRMSLEEAVRYAISR